MHENRPNNVTTKWVIKNTHPFSTENVVPPRLTDAFSPKHLHLSQSLPIRTVLMAFRSHHLTGCTGRVQPHQAHLLTAREALCHWRAHGRSTSQAPLSLQAAAETDRYATDLIPIGVSLCCRGGLRSRIGLAPVGSWLGFRASRLGFWLASWLASVFLDSDCFASCVWCDFVSFFSSRVISSCLV